ncbi:MAG: hypothetical protein QM692_14090 [Thermomicrobiales bacterium]
MASALFDALARGTACVSRRALVGLLGGVLAAGLAARLPNAPAAEAKRRRVASEHNVRGKRAILCVAGATRRVPRKQRKAYLKQGATRGACASSGPAMCSTGQKACDGGCIAVAACCTNADCASGEACQRGACAALPCGEGGPCRVFVSSSTTKGALSGPGGADTACQQLATGAGLSGAYMAWIGAGAVVPATRFTNTAKGGPYHLVANGTDNGGGPLVVNDFAAFTACSGGGDCLQHRIDRTEAGVELPNPAQVWTGIQATGLASVHTCSGWTSQSDSYSGLFGLTSAIHTSWTASNDDSCDEYRRIYCIEQPAAG